ncbi:MAG: class I SAM-dependent methyltransferase [Candidatus Altiarchaeota archaeon]
MRGDWFNAFKAAHNLEFTPEDYSGWSKMVDECMPFYLNHLPEGSSMLECCSGLGCTAIPLSHHYRVTAFDKDEGILEYTRKNAKRFGGDINVVNADFRSIVEKFGPDSYDACSSGGVLEHFSVDEIHELVNKQLTVAPLVFISVPLGDGKKTTDEHSITRYGYTRRQWLKEILNEHNLVDSMVSESDPKVSGDKPWTELNIAMRRI